MRRTPDRSVDLPLSTVTTTTRGYGLCEPYLVKVNHGGDSDRSMSLDKPMGTVTCKNGTALIQPYLVKFYGADKHGQPITEPLDTVTTKGRFALVVPTLNEKQPDIFEISFKFRMLAAHELAAAQGFMPDYQFAGNKSEIVKQIGNAVPRRLARAIVRASITQTP
jgi:DNA (cytosine-5)-methyltransferase 1